MVNESTLKKLRKLSSDLVMADISSPLEEWREVADAADELAGEFLQAGETDAQELAQLLGAVASSLSNGIIANPESGVKAARSVIGVLQGIETPAGMAESLRKQAVAEVNLFFRDVKKEESRVKEESSFEDDEERREMLIAIEQRIDELEAGLLALNPPVTDADEVRGIFRQFHTLKGEGAICGIKSVAEFCHGIESEIEDARQGGLVLTSEIVSVLQELAAVLRPILGGESREEIGEDLIQSLMSELRADVAASKAAGVPVAPEENAGEDKFADFFSGFAPPPAPSGEEEQTGDELQFLPESASEPPITAETLAEGLGDSLGAADFLAALEKDHADTADSGSEGGDESGVDLDAPFFDAPAAGTPSSVSFPAPEPAATVAVPPPVPLEEIGAKPKSARPGSDTVIESGELFAASDTGSVKKETLEKRVEENRVKAISVDVNRLDDLLETVSEVSLLGSFITTRLAGQEHLAVQTNNLIRACARLQEVANSLRMTSIRPLFMTVRRAAADSARASRKMIDINMQGIDTQVDRSIVESLSAALIHIIRNAVDHGIEPSDVRRRAGKPERGRIVISAARTNADIVIELGDDGKGFDLKAIHDKAVAMGKIAPDAKLTDEEVADLVFLPGLSTAKRITGLSGRGVGMEIVRNSINSLRGKVEIKTETGKGSTVRMRFPLTVTAMDAMLVRVGANILAIPVSQVRECFRPTAADIGTVEGRGSIVTIRGVILPVLFLGREFGIDAHARMPEEGTLVVVETGEKLAAVLVDETIGSSQVVVRTLEGPLADSALVAGAAILPDGGIGLVIETARLTDRVSTTASKAFSDAGRRQAESSRQIDTVSIGSNQVGMIDFNIKAPGPHDRPRTHVFAINAFKTREFVPLSPLRTIPGSPPGFAGIMMLRNVTVPVVHMGVVLGLMSEAERRSEWEKIVLICEFSGKTVGFLVSSVERVSYISWSDIMPPPSTGGLIQIEYVVGSILMSKLKGTLTHHAGDGAGTGGKKGADDSEAQVAFVLDFERIVGNVIQLYGDMGAELGDMGENRKDGIRILLVEDSPLIRKRTRKALEKAGITVIEAGDGQEAWETIGTLRDEATAAKQSIFTRLDLVLSDIEMPRMDGYTLTTSIKRDPALRVLPVLLHSSITNDNMIGRATEVEADGFIPKCDPKELANQLKKYL